MSAHKDASALATASMLDLIGRGKALQAAVIRQDDPAEIARMRAEAHDVLDAYLDRTTEAATHVRAILES